MVSGKTDYRYGLGVLILVGGFGGICVPSKVTSSSRFAHSL